MRAGRASCDDARTTHARHWSSSPQAKLTALAFVLIFTMTVFPGPARTTASSLGGPVSEIVVSCCNGDGTTYTIQWAAGIQYPSSTTIVLWSYDLECGDWQVTGSSSAFWHHPTPQECYTSEHSGWVRVEVWDYLTHAGETCPITGGSKAQSLSGLDCTTYSSSDPPVTQQSISYNNSICTGVFSSTSCGQYPVFTGTVGTQCAPTGSPPMVICTGSMVLVQTTPVQETSPLTGEPFVSTIVNQVSWKENATGYFDQLQCNLNASSSSFFSAAIPSTLLGGPFTASLNGAQAPSSTTTWSGGTIITLTQEISSTTPSTVTITGGYTSVGGTAPPYETGQTFTPNGQPVQTLVGSNQAVQTSFTNNSPVPVSAVVYAVVHNSAGQTVAYSTASLTGVPPGASATANDILFGLPPGTYTVTIFATSADGTPISNTSTITVTI